jgi:hypothetical protein
MFSAMANENPAPAPSRKAVWSGYAMSALPAAALAASGVMKLMKPAALVQGFIQFGFHETSIVPIGLIELACTVLYLIPRTSVLGAILVTGYFGGAIATTYRAGQGWLPTLVLGILVWGGLFMRDSRIRALIPLRRG